MKRSGLSCILLCFVIIAISGCELLDNGKWLSGDFHQHTFYTDGSTSFDFVMSKNNMFGLDFWANSEHGGYRLTDGNGIYWSDTSAYPEGTILGDIKMSGTNRYMWRWQSLRDFVWQNILRARTLYSDKRIFSGVEWNVPNHEHCSVSIVAKDSNAVSAFEYMFDASDYDTSRNGESTVYGTLSKQNTTNEDSIAAAAWMQSMYQNGVIKNAWIVFAHPERKGTWATGGYNIENYRDYNNAAPDICFGFEGAPGHQANSDRGGFGGSAFGGTYGGTGYYTATVGGLWDALLGEGRHWYNFANSDYHRHHTAGGDDFYPGEYQKTVVYVTDENYNGNYDLDEIANALRSGNVYHVMGDLISFLEFTAESGNKTAVMGEDLYASQRIRKNKKDKKPGSDITLTIKFKSPSVNNNGDNPKVDHVDIIAGEIYGKISPDSEDYTKSTNDTTKVIASYKLADCKRDIDGNYIIHHKIPRLSKNMYFRLRGTNKQVNTPYETDAHGNPLADSLVTDNIGLDGAAEAWADLWFYSNPIFVYVK